MKCWICGSENNSLLWKSHINRNLTSKDFEITSDKFGQTLTLYKCENCEFTFAHPLPENILELYENLEDDSYISTSNPRKSEMTHLVKIALREKTDAKNALDVGAGMGLMVKSLKEKDIDTIGVEPSKWLVKKAKELFGIELIEGIIPNKVLYNKRFDLIFAIDVIEHLPNPLEFLQLLKSYLNKNGLIIIATPDRGSFLAKILGKRWWNYRLAHIGYFNHKSMSIAVEKVGLKITRYERQLFGLPFGYLLKRISHYIPIKPIVKTVQKYPKVNDFPIKINLRDNIVAIING